MYRKLTNSTMICRAGFRTMLALPLVLVAAMAFYACGTAEDAAPEMVDPEDRVLAINEVMGSNRTGMKASDGKLYDWIEVKNISDENVQLEEYYLTFEKKDKGKKKGKTEKADKKDKAAKKDKVDKKENGEKAEKKSDGPLKWYFPEMELAPGAVVLIYASKRDIAEPGKPFHTNFKIASNGGCLRIMKRCGIVDELKYGDLKADESLRRTPSGKYEKTYEQTPGFDNDEKGFEAYCSAMEKQRKSPLLIWEAHSKGSSSRTVKGNNGWIELKNVSNAPVELSEYAITTKLENAEKWILPQKKLEPGDVFVVERNKGKFKAGDSETLLLFKGDKFVDGVCTKPAPYGVSVGRKTGKDGFFFFRESTKGKANTTQARRFIAPMPTFVKSPGVYPGQKTITVKLNTHGRKVHYTTDGSIPGLNSKVYRDSIRVTRNTVIRAYAEGDDDHLRSQVATGSYLVEKKHSMGVISISCNDGDLFNPSTGIYSTGPGAAKEHPHKGANYWKRVTKQAHVEFFDSKNKGYSLDCGLAIFGGFSRAEPKKSFKLKFKDIYGPSALKYDIFGTGKKVEMDNLVLRSGSQDIYGVMARDEFFTSLMHKECPELLVQEYRPVALYINGEYFGLYYIREKIDRDFVARKLNVSNDSVRIVMAGKYYEEGPDREWKSLMAYLRNKDMSTSECYKYVCDRLDVLAIADQNIAQIYASNTDMGNVRYVYTPDPKGDKKWHVVYYDIDASWSANTSVGYYVRTEGVKDGTFNGSNNIIVNRLLKNKEFRKLYLERFSYHLHKTFASEHAASVFDKLINTIRPEMPYNAERWPNVLPMEKWEKNVTTFRGKFADKPKKILTSLREELKITPAEEKKYFSDLGY